MRRTIFRSPSRPHDGIPRPNNGRVDPSDSDAILRRFTDMLMNDFNVGAPGRSGPDALFPPQERPPNFFFGAPPRFQRTTIVGSGPGGGHTSVTISTGPFHNNRADGPSEAPDFNSYVAPSPPTSQTVGPQPRSYTIIQLRTSTDTRNSVFGNLMNRVPPPNPADANDPNRPGAADGPGGPGDGPQQRGNAFAASLHEILAALLNPAGAVHGDAVYSQEALDRIITTLMESNPQSNAAPPASGAAIESLERKKVDEEMLGPEGKAECTICIDSIHKGDEVVVLPCKHWFHGECVTMWLKEHNTCPICRTPIEENSDAQPQRPAQSQTPTAGPSSEIPPTDPSLGRSRFRSPRENEERLNAIRNLGGYRASPSSTSQNRRSSMSPPSQPPSDHSSRTRLRSPSFSRDRDRDRGRDRDNDRDWSWSSSGERDYRQSRGGNDLRDDSSGNQGTGGYGPLGWLRDQFSRSSGSGSSNNRRQQ